jgi:hypothetical protein
MYELLHGVGPFEGPPDTTPTTREIYERVTSHTKIPANPTKLTDIATDLMNRLLCPDQAARIGATDVMMHPFFEGIDWDRLQETRAPFIPELSSLFDTSFFDDVGPADAPPVAPPTPMRRAATMTGISGLAMSLPFLGYGFMSPRVTTEKSEEHTPRAQRFIRRKSSLDHRMHARTSSSLSQISVLSRCDTPDIPEAPDLGGCDSSSPSPADIPVTPTPPAVRQNAAEATPETKPRRRRVSFNYDVIFLDAAKTGQLATVTDMVETHKVPVEKRTATGMTAVCLAATNGHVNVLRYLLAKGGKVNFQCPDGCTPLHLAILEERVDTVDFLMKHGADKTAKTPEGETPMDWAEDCEAILDILSKY